MNKTTSLKKSLHNYFSQIKSLFPFYSKKEKRFLKDFKESVLDYIEDNPNASIDDIILDFGDAPDIVYNYISSLSPEKLQEKLSLSSYIKRAIIVVMIFIFSTLIAYNIYLYDQNISSFSCPKCSKQNQLIHFND